MTVSVPPACDKAAELLNCTDASFTLRSLQSHVERAAAEPTVSMLCTFRFKNCPLEAQLNSLFLHRTKAAVFLD